jgi:glycerophosphoryl diester phosphodiesterase
VRGRPLRSLTKDELSELAGYEVPGVPDLMAKMAGRSHGHVDMKESGYEGEVVSLARELLGDDAFVVTGGDGCIATVKRLFPGIRCALSLGRDMWEIPMTRYVQVRRSELNPVERLRACGAEWVAVHRRYAVIGTLRTCAAHGIGAMVWTVNNSAMIRRFLRDPRVNVLITDRPAYAMEQRSLLTGRAT